MGIVVAMFHLRIPQCSSTSNIQLVPGASAKSVVEVSSIDAKVVKTISIYAKLTTSHNAVYYDFYGEPNNDFTAEWLKLVNGNYVSQQTWILGTRSKYLLEIDFDRYR